MTKHNKLVRDKIPEIIESNGGIAHYSVIDSDANYLQALLEKDVEEGKEITEDPSLEELADKLEVLYAIGKAIGYTPVQIEQARLSKLEERGGFNNRIFLEKTE